ncbi:MAG: hypothetical protein ABIS47_14915 [Acidimicrobiales bacterium]
MSASTTEATPVRTLLNKVPEVTIWFWIIKILCTTVGESFADWINTSLGVGLEKTSLIFTVVLIAVLFWQVRLRRYVPFAYWSTVVVLSVTGTLYTDILTDDLKVPLAVSTGAFAVALAAVFGVWFHRERTLSIHSILTLPRESFYWLAILVTFALGTAAGDWTLELTGWGPGVSVLLPSILIAAVIVGWRLGANPVLAFWLAYILTRPLGANLGDWLASAKADGGLGLGTAGTSALFLVAILGTVAYLSVTRRDATERHPQRQPAPPSPGRQRGMLVYFALLVVMTVGVLARANAQPHAAASENEAAAPAPPTGASGASIASQVLTPQEATQAFPSGEIAKFRTIAQDTLTKVQAGNQAAATKRVKDLESAWDADQATLQPRNQTAWSLLDRKVDTVLKALRAKTPDAAAERDALQGLLQTLV